MLFSNKDNDTDNNQDRINRDDWCIGFNCNKCDKLVCTGSCRYSCVLAEYFQFHSISNWLCTTQKCPQTLCSISQESPPPPCQGLVCNSIKAGLVVSCSFRVEPRPLPFTDVLIQTPKYNCTEWCHYSTTKMKEKDTECYILSINTCTNILVHMHTYTNYY